MRIIGGEFASLRLDVPSGLKLRPTTDMAKEAVFSTLSSLITLEEVRALDLFSGTGSIGFEFVSRGANEVLMVDKHPRQIAFIKSVIARLKVSDRASARLGDVKKLLTKASLVAGETPFPVSELKADAPLASELRADGTSKAPFFDIIFADPPYDLSWLPELPEMVFASELLSPEGVFVLEHPSAYDFSQAPYCFKHKRYSAVNFSFFRLTASSNP